MDISSYFKVISITPGNLGENAMLLLTLYRPQLAADIKHIGLDPSFVTYPSDPIYREFQNYVRDNWK